MMKCKDGWLSRMLIIGLVATFVVALDQSTKHLVVSLISLHEQIVVIPNFFNLTLIYNPGVAFGMGAELGDGIRQVVLALLAGCALIGIFYFLVKDYMYDRVAQVSIALVVGGGVGNIIDRVSLGRVVDFLDFYYGSYHWPAFNVADSAICVGVVILLFRKPASHIEQAGQSPDPDEGSSLSC